MKVVVVVVHPHLSSPRRTLPNPATKIMIKKIARDKHPRVVIISLKVVSFTSFLDLPKKMVNFVNLVFDNSFPSIKSPSFLLNLFPFPDKTLSCLCPKLH